jgi:predicted alpha/beta hydrolase
MTRALRALLLFPLLVACYVYRPVTEMTPVGKDRVRLTLTDSGAVSLASQLGPATEEVQGRVVADSAGAYVMSVLATRRRGGAETDWSGEQVAVPRIFVAHAQERRFSRQRTILASLGLAAAAIVAREAFWGPGGVFAGAPPGGSPGPR